MFGDNDEGKGRGGQAIIRNCKNSIGIPTKKMPSNQLNSFYTDEEFKESIIKIQRAIIKIIKKSRSYEKIIFPKDGFGSGLAKLAEKAPKTFNYLNNIIFELFGVKYF